MMKLLWREILVFLLLLPIFVLAETLTFNLFVGETFNLPNGGSFTYTDTNGCDITFEVPADFYSEDLELQLVSNPSSVVAPAKPSPSGQDFVGRVYEFDFFTLSGEAVTTLDEAVTITMCYFDDDLGNLLENTLSPYRWGGSEWESVTINSVDTEDNIVTLETVNFSSFALVASEPEVEEEEEEEEEATPSGGGGGGSSGGIFLSLFPFLAPSLPPISPDLNNDGIINIVDLSILLYFWDKTGTEIIPYDLNSDGIIDIVDASILFYHWTG